ncbi:MAG: hypothetical protein K5777_03325 [Nitrosopumilus sp.]|nr:hypothetical protein [Nitrosopumilus sp.]
MENTLLALKISPKDVLPLLQIIESSKTRDEIEKKTFEYYKKSSKDIHSPHISPFRVRVAHSFRKLGLITGDKHEIKLTPEAKFLLEKSENLDKFKKEFSRLILHLDQEKVKLINFLKKIDGSFTYNDIVENFEKEGITIKKTDDKLRRWLQFLFYCDLISFSSPYYEINLITLTALDTAVKKVSIKEFEKILYEEYEILKKNKGSYVPILDLTLSVSNKLKHKGFAPIDFKEHLLKTISSKPKKQITLSETGVRKEGGIIHNKVYYYFLSIHEK